MGWNKVTTFSKILALALFVALPFFGFWWGIQYGEAIQEVHSLGAVTGAAATATSSASDYYANVAAWQTDRNNAAFVVAYPIDFDYQDGYAAKSVSDWRVGAAPNEAGVIAFTLTIPRALEPQTNFADAKFTVSYGTNAAAATDCMKPDAGGEAPTAAAATTINGVSFTAFHSSGAGAGNYYETTSYRALHGGKCWAVEYTVHSTQIANYPASYGLTPFDKSYVTGILDRIAGTFQFTK